MLMKQLHTNTVWYNQQKSEKDYTVHALQLHDFNGCIFSGGSILQLQ